MLDPLAMLDLIRPGIRPRNTRPFWILSFSNDREDCVFPSYFPDCLMLFTTSAGQTVNHARFAQIAPLANGDKFFRVSSISAAGTYPAWQACFARSTYTTNAANKTAFRPRVIPVPFINSLMLHECSTCFLIWKIQCGIRHDVLEVV